MPKILISGFEPFYTHKDNASAQLVSALKNTNINGFNIAIAILPVVQWASIEKLKSEISKHAPRAVVALGQSKRSEISLERIARNKDHFKIRDNAGNQPPKSQIVVNGPMTYPTTLPIEAWLPLLKAENIPVHLSDSAGTFVCNHLFYGLQHHLRNSMILSGFVHVPMLPEQVDSEHAPFLAFEKQLRGLRLILEDLTLKLSEVKEKR